MLTALIIGTGVLAGGIAYNIYKNYKTIENLEEAQNELRKLQKAKKEFENLKENCKRVKVDTDTGNESIINSLENAENRFRNGGHIEDGKILCEEEFNSCKEDINTLYNCINDLYLSIEQEIEELKKSINELEDRIDELD